MFDFMHYDLHRGNILIKKLSRVSPLPIYNGVNKIGYVSSRYVATIIDFGYSCATIDGHRIENMEPFYANKDGRFLDRTNPLYDIVYLLDSLSVDTGAFRAFPLVSEIYSKVTIEGVPLGSLAPTIKSNKFSESIAGNPRVLNCFISTFAEEFSISLTQLEESCHEWTRGSSESQTLKWTTSSFENVFRRKDRSTLTSFEVLSILESDCTEDVRVSLLNILRDKKNLFLEEKQRMEALISRMRTREPSTWDKDIEIQYSRKRDKDDIYILEKWLLTQIELNKRGLSVHAAFGFTSRINRLKKLAEDRRRMYKTSYEYSSEESDCSNGEN